MGRTPLKTSRKKRRTKKAASKSKKSQTPARTRKQSSTSKKAVEPKPGSIECDECGLIISRKADLKRHKRTHLNKGEVGHKCPHPGCGHYSLQKSNLVTHMRQHDDTKPKVCMYSPCEYACKDGSLLNRHMREVHGHVPLQRPSPIRTRTRSSHASHISPTPSPPPLQPHVFSSPVHLDTPQQVSRTTQSVYDSQYKPRMPDGPFTVPRIARHNPSPAFSCGEALQDEISYPASGFCAPYDYNVQTNIATSSYGSMFGQGQYSRLRDESHNDTSMLSMHWQGSALVASSISAPNADIFEADSSYSYPASNRPFTFDPVQGGYTYAAFTPGESDSYFWAAYQ